MKEQLVRTLKNHFLAKIENHKTNIQIMLDNPQSIPEHSDWIETVEKEVEKLAHFNDLHESFCKYFDEGESPKSLLNEDTEYKFEHDPMFYTNT
tara:strand:+ start:419 stop:700 length:282 start_codon:yes stop_codon:yes gene_type:complete